MISLPKKILPLLLLLTTPLAAAVTPETPPPLPTIPQATFTITDHGATPTSPDNAKAIQATIDAAASAGGGTILIPAGNFLSGPFRLASNINLHLDKSATLTMLPMQNYPGGTTTPPNFITGQNLHDVALSGEGTIEGQGSPWWPLAKTTPSARRPRMIALSACDKILIENLHLQNSPMFHIAISGRSSNVTVRSVTIRAPASTNPTNPSHNTDACDVSASHVYIHDCDVSVGDDNFTCGGGTSDVLISHCTYGFGHGVSIGSPTNGGISDLTVEDCTFTNTEAGIRIKSDRDRGGTVQRLTYRNLTMTNVNFPILIYAAYNATDPKFRDLTNLSPDTAATYPAQPLADRTPVYRDITFSNITATAAKSRRAGLIWGLPESPITNLTLQNVNITAEKPLGLYNISNLKAENCHLLSPDGKDLKPTLYNTQLTP